MLIVFLLSVLLQIRQNSPQQNRAPQKGNRAIASEIKEGSKPNPPSTPNSPSSEKEATRSPNDHSDGFDQGLYRAYEIATILGFLGGLVGLYFIWKQSTQTEIAAKTARDSADAALLNARAIINAERPWMFIEITVRSAPVAIGDVAGSISFSVKFRNWGKTPAEIVGFDEHCDCCDSTDDLPVPPKYSLEGEVLLHTRLTPPTKDWDPPGGYFVPSEIFGNEDWQKVHRSQKRLMYWGRLQYRDLIEDAKTIHDARRPVTIHDTCFCYFWSPRLNEFLMTGPFGYNKHT